MTWGKLQNVDYRLQVYEGKSTITQQQRLFASYCCRSHNGLSESCITAYALDRSRNVEAHLATHGIWMKFSSLFELSAAYGYGFARNHCFADGNKRIALVSIDVFLIRNGFELVADEADAASIIEELAAGEISESELAKWIEANTQEFPQP